MAEWKRRVVTAGLLAAVIIGAGGCGWGTWMPIAAGRGDAAIGTATETVRGSVYPESVRSSLYEDRESGTLPEPELESPGRVPERKRMPSEE